MVIQNDNEPVASSSTLTAAEITRLQELFQLAPGFMAVVEGPQHVFKVANQAFMNLVGEHCLLGLPAEVAIPGLVEQKFLALANQAYASGEPFCGQQVPVRVGLSLAGSHTLRYLDFVIQPLVNRAGLVYGLFIQGQDVTDRKTAQEELRISNDRWKFAIEGVDDGVWDWDLGTNAVFVSSRYKDILKYSPTAAFDTFQSWSDAIHPRDRPEVLAALNEMLEDGTQSQAEYRIRCSDGRYKWVLSRATVVVRDDHGRPLRVTGTLTDVSQKKSEQEVLRRQASTDQLTGLPNRHRFRDQLEAATHTCRQHGDLLGLLLIDLDHFKEINDLRGQDLGDRLLIQVAERLKSCLSPTGTVARLGGDEFAISLPAMPERSAVEHMAREIIIKLTAPFRLAGELTYISASIGVTIFPDQALDTETLLRNADQAMYAAKQAGRNQFELFTPTMREEAHGRMQLVQDLRAALAGNQLHLHYQPIVELSSGRIVKAESLLRWIHPVHGFVDPSRFIPIAEEYGLIHEIGNWVFAEASSWAQRWSNQLGKPFQLSVNCSPLQFLDRPADWLSFLTNSGIPPRHLALEITEGVLLGAAPQITALLSRYREAGMQLALDDFGTGYSSLRYLMQFDIDYLKIDKSFVHDISKNAGGQAIVESIIGMAHRLGMKVIAEGIEEPEQEDFLRSSGCDYGQGYLFSRPVPAQRFEHLLSLQGA